MSEVESEAEEGLMKEPQLELGLRSESDVQRLARARRRQPGV